MISFFQPTLVVRCLLLAVLLMSVCSHLGFARSKSSGHSFGPLLFSKSSTLGPIYYSETATEAEIAAAIYLSEVLSRISGLEWSVEVETADDIGRGIYIGKTDKARLEIVGLKPLDSISTENAVLRIEQTQSFQIVTQSKSVFLIGSTTESTVFSIYYFLGNYLGVRWFIPGEIGEETPNLSRKRLPRVNKVFIPSYLDRTLIAGLRSKEGKEWGSRNLLNKQWNFNHNLHRVIVPDFFETKPQWFSLHGDKRVPTKGGRGPNPNIANPEVARFVATEAIQFFEDNPKTETFSIAVTDNVRFDESADTLDVVTPFEYFRNRPNYSDLVFGFSNQVANEIWPLDDDPQIQFDDVPESARDKFLGTLAYYWAEQVPSFPVHPRIIPYLTSDRGQWFSDAYREEDKKLIEAWCAAGPEIVGTWDYYEGGPYFIPRGFMRSVAESIPFMREAGIRAFFAEGGPMWGFDAPRLWLAAQLLWDAEQDPDSLIDEFFQGYYKESAEPMRSFFGICERIWYAQTGPPIWLKYYLMPSQAELFPPEVWNELEAKLSQAERMANCEKVKARLALVRNELTFGAAMSDVYFSWKNDFHSLSAGGSQTLHKARSALKAITPPVALQRYGKMKEMMLEVSDFPLKADRIEESRYLLSESFGDSLVDGDDTGVGPLPFVGAKLRDGWSTSSFHNQSFNFTRVPLQYPRGNMAARITGTSYFNLFDWLPVEPGKYLSAQMRFRGVISPGSRIKISLRWMDEKGVMLEPEKFADAPVGNYTEWRVLSEGAFSPPDAAWALFGLSIQEQMPDDYIEIDTIEVTESIISGN